MKFSLVFLITICLSIFYISTKSQDYARHIELSLLFYECQRSGPLPKTNRIFWRHDSMLNAGEDVGIDLTGGYYDAGDNVKFNFPGASALTLIAWSGIDFAEGYKKAGQWENLLDAVKWGADYFIKCHSGKNELYVQVGNGQTDHQYWYPPEYIKYDVPSYKIDASNPGSDCAAETAAFLAATSILFKAVDSSYSSTCLKHAIEIYDFADKYRGSYSDSVKQAQGFYTSYSGFNDELVWGAAWLLRATGEEKYREMFDKIAEAEYGEQDPKKYYGNTGPISWDDKRPGAYVLIAMITKEEKHMQNAYKYCDAILKQPRTPGGLWYDKNLSQWASNRYAANAASMLALFASILPESDLKHQEYIDFVKSQIDYILGDNPAGVNYVVGAEENSPKAVHHRGASGTYDSTDKNAKPYWDIFTLYGALAGGPGPNDSYTDTRTNYQMNEVALDYNAGFTVCLAGLVHFGLGVKDSGDILNFDRAWPQKAPTPDITVTMTDNLISVSTGSGMLCSAWCVLFETDAEITQVNDCIAHSLKTPNYIICNRRESNFLDGEGTPQVAKIQVKGSFVPPTEFKVLCDGFHAPQMAHDHTYKPEYGHMYKVTSPGGPSNTEPLFEMTKCWPDFICK